MASVGVVNGAKNIYNNIKNGEILSWSNLLEVGATALNIYTASVTGKNLSAMGKSFAGNVAKKWSGAKNSSAKNNGTTLVTHRGINESIARKLEIGYLEANYPKPDNAITKFIDHSKPVVWISKGKPTIFNRIFSGMVGKRGEESITFEVDSSLIKKPNGIIKRFFGNAQMVIEENVYIPDDVIVKFGGSKK